MATAGETPGAAHELALSNGQPYTGLRDLEFDHRLFHYVPLPIAHQLRIVPLLLVGDTLKVASASPFVDLSLLRRRFPYLAVDIVIAPGPEIDRVLERAQRTT